MKASEVYRKAAHRKETVENCFVGCCYSIHMSAGNSLISHLLADRMKGLFRPHSVEPWWMGPCDAKNHEIRILALCFMAAIAEDEERGKGRRSS